MDINSHDQRLLLGVKSFHKKLDKQIRNNEDTKKVKEIQ